MAATESERKYSRERTCAFTGHRRDKLPWGEDEDDPRCLALKSSLHEAVENVYGNGIEHFICGMATGADFYFCEAVLKVREKYGNVTLEAALPCPAEQQTRHWSAADRRRYYMLLEQCDRRTVLLPCFTRYCMQNRNRYMVDASDCLIAVFNGTPGGTESTVLYAMRKKLQIILLSL